MLFCMKIRILPTVFFVFFFYFGVNAQELDSLDNLINNAKTNLEKTKYLIQKGRIVSRTNENKARIIFQQAELLAAQNKWKGPK